MSTARMRIKVEVSALIAKIASAKADALGEYERENALFDAKLRVWCDKAATHLRTAATLLENGDPSTIRSTSIYHDGSSRSGVWAVTPRLAAMPTKRQKPNVAQYDKDIALLKMSADSVLSISTDDHFARYL